MEEIGSEPYASVFYRDGRSATLQVESLVGKGWFQFPKNTEVLAELIELVTGPDDLVLDFFAGSGSTGHAVWDVNVAHSSSRRFIMVQLPEPTDREGYRTIAEIGERRLANASDRMKEEHPKYDGDLGFRVFALDSSNVRPWDPSPEALEQTLLDSVDNIKEDRKNEDVLYELLLKLGLDLAAPIETRMLAKAPVFVVGAGALVVCLEKDVAPSLIDEIVRLHNELRPEIMRVVFRDACFADDVAKTNAVEALRLAGIDDVQSI